MRILKIIILALISLIGISATTAAFDHTYESYGKLLDKYTKEGLVNYKGLKNDHSSLESVTAQFIQVRSTELAGFNRNQKISFWINAYNFFTIKAVVENYPVKSIKDINGVWNKLKWEIAGESYTLDNIEHDILRKEFKEPRVHVALVCASISCPQLPDFPLSPDSLESQLELLSYQFANDTLRNRFEIEGDKLFCSKILKWYGDDFKEIYGPGSPFEYLSEKESATINFLYKNSAEYNQRRLLDNKVSVKYLDYDWDLNEF